MLRHNLATTPIHWAKPESFQTSVKALQKLASDLFALITGKKSAPEKIDLRANRRAAAAAARNLGAS